MNDGYENGGAIDERLYVIERPGPKGRIKLSPLAKELAAMHGMTLTELARHLLMQEQLRDSGLSQRQGEN